MLEKSVHPQRQLEAVFSSMLDGVVIQDKSGKIIQFNDSALKILKLSAEQLIGKTSYDPKWRAISTDMTDLPGARHPASLALATGEAQVNQIMGVHAFDDSLRWLSVTAVPLFECVEGLPYQVVITFRDITEERRVVRELEDVKVELVEREVFLNKTLSSLPCLVCYVDDNFFYRYANDVHLEWFNVKAENCLGQKLNSVFQIESFEKVENFFKYAHHGDKITFETKILNTIGAAKYVLIDCLCYHPPEMGAALKGRGCYIVATDISRMKKLEAERREIEAKLIMSSKMSTLGEMAAGIAHEINNPLCLIGGTAFLLRQKIKKEKVDMLKMCEELANIENTVERIAKITHGLLAFARNAERDPVAHVSLLEIINETLKLCGEKLKKNGILVKVSVDPKLKVSCRFHQVTQIFMNLLNNAVDAIQHFSEKWIEIEAKIDADKVIIRIIDSGLGISIKIRDKIMQPFFTTKELGKGTGLGLSISKGLAMENDGDLVYEEGKENTCFILTLRLPKS